MTYKVEKREDKYYLMNNGGTSFDYEVKQLSNCVSYSTISDGTLLASTEVEIALTEDGEYQIEITDGVDVITIPIKYYLDLQTSFIDSVYNIICDCSCGCDDCSEGVDTCSKYCNLLLATAKVEAYKRLINPEAVAFFDAVYKQVKCLIQKPIYCAIAEEKILGEAQCNSKFIKQLIALDYLALYFYELVSLPDDEDYIKEKFNIEKIFCCIQELGINIGNIEQTIEDNMGTFTIESAAYINQPPTIGDYTLGVDNRTTTVLTLAMFTSATTPAYSDPEGDAPAAVRINTLPGDGVLYLDGIAVTPGQIIDVADINSNLLTFEAPDQDAIDVDTFTFDVQDSAGNWST